MRNRTLNNLKGFAAGVLLIIAIAVSMEAGATTKKSPPKPTADASAEAWAVGKGGSAHAEGGDAKAYGGKGGASDASVVTGDLGGNVVDNSNNSSDDDVSVIYETGAASAIPAQPWTHIKCGSVLGASGQGNGQGWALGIPVPRWMSRQIQDCERENDAAWLQSIGLIGDAFVSRCGKKSMQERFGGTAKGGKARTQACIDHFKSQVSNLATAQGRVTELETENERLRENVNTLLEERNHDRVECDERVGRCEERLREGK